MEYIWCGQNLAITAVTSIELLAFSYTWGLFRSGLKNAVLPEEKKWTVYFFVPRTLQFPKMYTICF